MSFGIYVHVPFCRSKCPYCDFYSLLDRDKGKKGEYVRAVCEEIRGFDRYFRNEEGAEHIFIRNAPDSIYFGGGTPSLLDPSEISKILDASDSVFGVAEDREVTLEANPRTIDLEKLRAFREAGVNRLSMGVQSFDDSILRKLGRTHKACDALDAYRDAREAGFDNISIDLIFGIDGQTMGSWRESIGMAVKLYPEHISLYSLEFMEGTAFTKMLSEGRMKETDPDIDREMYEKAVEMLNGAGYGHYEISNFALPGRESCHNLKYWNLDDYAGFGPGAHSYMTDLVTGQGQRYYHIGDLDKYLGEPCGVEWMEPNGYADDMTEFVITALRLSKGISKRDFCERFGQDLWDFYGDLVRLQFKSFIDTGHAYEDEDNIRLTLKGFNVSNQILSIFV